MLFVELVAVADTVLDTVVAVVDSLAEPVEELVIVVASGVVVAAVADSEVETVSPVAVDEVADSASDDIVAPASSCRGSSGATCATTRRKHRKKMSKAQGGCENAGLISSLVSTGRLPRGSQKATRSSSARPVGGRSYRIGVVYLGTQRRPGILYCTGKMQALVEAKSGEGWVGR